MARPERADAALKLLAIEPAGVREFLRDMGGCRDGAVQALEYLRQREWVHGITVLARGYMVFGVTELGRKRLARMGYAP